MQGLEGAVARGVPEDAAGPVDARGDAAADVLAVAPACSVPTRRSNSGQSTRSSSASRPNHAATPAARPRSVMACSETTWKLDPIAAGRVSARAKA